MSVPEWSFTWVILQSAEDISSEFQYLKQVLFLFRPKYEYKNNKTILPFLISSVHYLIKETANELE